ncbi:hypothetical protein EXN66_Car009807 [Channa argus]|uniref:Ig-like domain-containing protein n=2 Tax=Channa argus TaxID=215402 RepID=A0A6G1PUW5_CHAAH|nr:hypothetical protein EXN66_Car009807 [Channa argus]
MRLVSGNFPEVLGKTSYILETVEPRITVSRQPGTFDLLIKNAQLSDTAVYICLKTQHQDIIFLIGTVLKVEGPETDMTAAPPSNPVLPGDSVTIQCSVSENETYPEENSVCCFRAGFNLSHPSFNYTQGNTVDESKNKRRVHNKCVFNYFPNSSSSDAGTYCCSVASRGEKLPANRSKPSNEGVKQTCSKKDNTIIFLLSAALAISLLVIAFLFYLIKKLQTKSCDCCNASVVLQTNATASMIQESQQTDEESLVYSAPNFTRRKSSKAERKDPKPSEEESIYTTVRAVASD